MKGLRVAVLMGGLSSERDVSLRTGSAVSSALVRRGYRVIKIDLTTVKGVRKDGDIFRVSPQNLSEFLRKKKVDCVFLALHGGIGENGAVQGFLEVLGMRYTGSGILASAIAMNKVISKRLFKEAGIPVADYEVVNDTMSLDEILSRFNLPLIVKPVAEGSSIGVSLVESRSDLKKAVEMALGFGHGAIIERYIKGREIHVGVLKERAIGAVEVRPKKGFYSYEAKYTPGMTDYIIPPELSPVLLDMAMRYAEIAHNIIGSKGATRVDFIVDDKTPYILEVNTIPGMTETSLLPKIAMSRGIKFDELVEEILLDALQDEKIKKA